jgi:hypothetical protein
MAYYLTLIICVWTRLSEVLLWKVCQVGAGGGHPHLQLKGGGRCRLAEGVKGGSPPYTILTSGVSGLLWREKNVVSNMSEG